MSHSVRNWTDLPEPLMAKVLKGLPFSSLVALRRVSKEWAAIIICHASICSPNPVVRHFLLGTNGEGYISYSPLKDQWFQGSPIPPKISTNDGLDGVDDGLDVRGSAGGLVLLVQNDLFIVSNPMTKYYKVLPKVHEKDAYIHRPMDHALRMQYRAMGMCYHASSRSYQIIVAESDFENNGSSTTAVYDSAGYSWAITPGMKGKMFITHAFMHLPYSNGSFFGIVASAKSGDDDDILARYRVQQQTWSEVEVSPTYIARGIVSPYLGEMDGQILVAGRVPILEVWSVWEMSHVEGKWKLVKAKGMSRLSNFARVETVFVGDFLLWRTIDYPSLLVQNIKLQSWRKARELPKHFRKSGRGRCVAFEPSLTATP